MASCTGQQISISASVAKQQASLIISEAKLKTPPVVAEALRQLEASWQRPDGDELVDVLSKARCAREFSCGFYYRWTWPRGEPVAVIERWLAARKAWHKELREKLKTGAAHMDSPLLLTQAAIRWQKGYVYIERDHEDNELGRREIPPRSTRGPRPVWDSKHWPEWEAVRGTAQPETEAVWLSDFFIEECIDWLAEKPGLLWYEFNAVASRLLSLARDRALGLTHGGPGEEGTKVVLGLTGKERVVASISAHGTGRNLQPFSRNFVANPPSSGAKWEQLLGRTHRQGQEAEDRKSVV